MKKNRIVKAPNGLVGVANNMTSLIEKLRELADEKGFFVLESDLSKDTKYYDYLYMCLLQKWLRDKHGILVYAQPRSCNTFRHYITTYDNEIIIIGIDRLNNWEEALQEGLKEALNEIE